MVNSVKIKYYRGRQFIEVDGELWVNESAKIKSSGHLDELKFIPYKDHFKKEYDSKINALAEVLSKSVSSKEIIKNKLQNMSIEMVEALIRAHKKKPKIKKRYGCLELVIGKEVMPIVEM